MAHDTYIESNGSTREPVGAQLGLIAGLLAVVLALILTDMRATSLQHSNGVIPASEDWHGNVRRSHGVH